QKIEDDPYLNFISVLKNYKILGSFLNGTLYELHRDRNNSYMRNFFIDKGLYAMVKADIEWLYSRGAKYREIMLTITKRGVIIYDNYKKNSFNVLLTTIHSGTWMRRDIQAKQSIAMEKRLLEEDIDTHKIYSSLVLKKGGIWIDNKASRFACDYNRTPERAIYSNRSEKWIKDVWKEPLSEKQRRWLMEGYNEFYFTLGRLIEAYRFNIIFDGHSMKDAKGRPEFSFGTKYIPKFYMPVVRSMQHKLSRMNYGQVALNTPYSGGHILQWLNNKFQDIFICSMEVNKKVYMTKNRKKVIAKRLEQISKDITQIFDIGDELP
ncbi:MAG TPA: N-formylglutamate amidohydrolase, partial [Candidatus Brocadiales bacterium]|nr:N-formylglutamate amidohydrolase [Candidatus Brocadiales bacterium]